MFVNSDVSYTYLLSYKAYTAPTVYSTIFDRTRNITSFSSPVFLDRIRNTNVVARSEEGTYITIDDRKKTPLHML